MSIIAFGGVRMSYEEINKANRNYMKGTIREGPVMEWNDSSLMDTLMGRMPKLRVTNKDDQVRTEIHKLQSILETYRYTETNCDDFLKEISAIINRIWDVEPYWYGFTIDEISYFLAMQRFCVISGFGGMGKSYFIYRLEEQLEENSIPHLCIYGKYQKELNSIDFSEIHSAANNGVFLLIVDAINELDHSIQTELIKKIQPLLACNGLRVIITYRTHRLSGDIVALLNSLATYQYTFSGVSYESALEVILRKPVLNVYKYESILYSNNAFYLQMLCKVLSKPVVKDEEINSFSILTHILEAYIKDTLGKECWVYTKMIAKWMYDNRRRDIPRTELLTIIKKPDNYIQLMKQYGLFNEVEFHNELNYSFSIESLSDYMLARYFVQEISGKTESEQLEIIKQRRSEFFGMDEVFIVSLFDLSNDYDLIKRLLKSSGLISSFDFEALLHINFNLSDIKPFQLAFPINDTANPLLMLGGYSEKPFNCVNYLNDYYLTASYRQKKELSSLLSGQIISGRLTDRLKNMIYFVSVVKTDITDEMLWFALWCTASANQKTRCYAIKLLYEIVLKKPQYIEVIIASWEKFSDYYIQEAVIQVFSFLTHIEGHGIQEFLSACMDDPSFHLAKSIKRIGVAQGAPYGYIQSEKENLYHPYAETQISKDLNDLFWHLDFTEKYLLPFRYYSEDHVDGITKFLSAPKKEVELWNRKLTKRFSCVRNGQCAGSVSFEKWLQAEYEPSFSLDSLDVVSFLLSFGKCIENIMIQYGINVYKQQSMSELSFSNSLYRKVVDIAIDNFYGSIMCNYFTGSFSSFNNTQNSIGFDIYDPLEFNDEEIHLASPISTYESTIEAIGDAALSVITRFDSYDDGWSKDAEQSIANIQKLLQPVKHKKTEWVMLNAKIRLSSQERTETYDIHCCTDPNIHLTGRYDDRFLSIESPEYAESIALYHVCTEKPWVCKEIPSIKKNKDWFDPTELMFPPAQIVSDLNLHYELTTMSWNTDTGDIVIRCDNNKKSYIRSEISSGIFMRKDYYDLYVASKPIHFFCFTEKMIKERGFTDEASLHLEFSQGKLTRQFFNADEQKIEQETPNQLCQTCPYGFVSTGDEKDVDIDEYFDILKQLGYSRTSDAE